MFLPVVQQSLHQAGDGGDQRDAALPPRLPLNLFQQTGGRNEEDTETGRRCEDQKPTQRTIEKMAEGDVTGKNI